MLRRCLGMLIEANKGCVWYILAYISSTKSLLDSISPTKYLHLATRIQNHRRYPGVEFASWLYQDQQSWTLLAPWLSYR